MSNDMLRTINILYRSPTEKNTSQTIQVKQFYSTVLCLSNGNEGYHLVYFNDCGTTQIDESSANSADNHDWLWQHYWLATTVR